VATIERALNELEQVKEVTADAATKKGIGYLPAAR
jgi:hypothetical protein